MAQSSFLRRSVLISLSAVSGPPDLDVFLAALLAGRFGYSDLKEAALSVAAGLWVLNRLGLVTPDGDAGLVAF